MCQFLFLCKVLQSGIAQWYYSYSGKRQLPFSQGTQLIRCYFPLSSKLLLDVSFNPVCCGRLERSAAVYFKDIFILCPIQLSCWEIQNTGCCMLEASVESSSSKSRTGLNMIFLLELYQFLYPFWLPWLWSFA